MVVSNQGGVSLKPNTKAPKAHTSKVASFKEKASAVFNQLDIPISIYAATEKDIYRKPRTGIWTELLDDDDIQPDLEQCIFVGDAGGRHADGGKPKDFSCSDRYAVESRFTYKCLHKIGILRRTSVSSSKPPRSFSSRKPRGRSHVHSSLPITYPNLRLKVLQPPVKSHNAREKTNFSLAIAPFVKRNDLDLVIFCGSPGAGKSSFYWKFLKPLGYTRVNQDILKTVCITC